MNTPQERQLVTEIPGPRSRELLTRRDVAVPAAVFNTVPVFARAASRAVLEDVDGNRLIDLAAGIAVLDTGSASPAVVEAARDQLEKYIHTCFHVVMSEPYVAVAERLNALTPGSHQKKTILANSGAEAVENAVKIARRHTQRAGVVVFDHAFHGRTLLAMSMTGKVMPYKQGFGPFTPEVYRLPFAYPCRCPRGASADNCGEACAEYAVDEMEHHLGPAHIACVVVESLLGEGGYVIPGCGFLPALKAFCERHGALFVADEVQTGLGRTGRWFAIEDVAPDIVITGKALGGGFPLSGVTAVAEVMDGVHVGGLGGTFGGTQSRAPPGLLSWLRSRRRVWWNGPSESARQGWRGCRRWGSAIRWWATCGGRGVMLALELVTDRATKEPAKDAAAAVIHECSRQGVIVMKAGTYDNVVRLMPPLSIGEDLLLEGLDVLGMALAASQRQALPGSQAASVAGLAWKEDAWVGIIHPMPLRTGKYGDRRASGTGRKSPGSSRWRETSAWFRQLPIDQRLLTVRVRDQRTAMTSSELTRVLPSGLPSGMELVAEGRALGRAIDVGTSAFCSHHGVRSEVEYRRRKRDRGEVVWSMIMGLASLDEQIGALRYLEEFGRRTGVVIDRGLVIPNWVTGLPEDLRDQAPKGTSFVLGGVDEHVRIAQAAAIMPCFNDWHIGSPAAVPNTIAAIRAGSSYTGVLAQYVWDLPYCDDDVRTVAENVRAIGIAAEKRSSDIVVDSYMDDGMPSQFADNASLVGYARLERYVVDELCGARYATGFGQLVSDIPTKIAIWLALHDVLRADHPAISYLYGNTIDASDTLVTGNYGITAAEIVAFVAAERRYRTGAAILPNPSTEKLRVPTVEEIADVHAVARAAAGKAAEFGELLDFEAVERTRAVLVKQGSRFFQNILARLSERGVDVQDPLQVLLGARRIGAPALEAMCHPGERDPALPNGIVPFSPTEFSSRTAEYADRELAEIRSRGLDDAVRGRAFVVASADTHLYGLAVLSRVLRVLGADVIDAGVDRDPEDLAKLASDERQPALAVSTHNGQCVGYAERLVRLLRKRGAACQVYMGGKLNTLAGAEGEPMDASQQLAQFGILPCSTVADLVGHASKGPSA